MMRQFGLILAATAALSVAAHAAPVRERIRGTVASVGDGSMTVHTTSGQDVTVGLNGSTHYAKVLKGNLDQIDKNTFIGTAAKNVGSELVALEVVVFPNSMRGSGEGHYPWDRMRDTTIAGGAQTASTMTNGNVAAVQAGGAGRVDTTMTNGTVATTNAAGGAKQLTVTYKGGEQHILVPPTTPIVMLQPGAKSDVAPGDGVFINALKNGSTLTAASVAVGVGGVKPPM
jgi:hypothetical protein